MLVSESVSDIDSTESKGIRLPKLDVPVFDGNILNWRRFWEQFSVSIHERSSLADLLRMVRQRVWLKDCPNRGRIMQKQSTACDLDTIDHASYTKLM